MCNTQVDEMITSSGQEQSPLLEKQTDMNEMFRTVMVTARDKQNQLHDTLKQVERLTEIIQQRNS